jgi:Bacteriophage tail sheath protein
MATYDTPGAYIERDDRAQGGISRLRTDVAAFVGIAERGPVRRAVAVESWKQFQAIFGGAFVHGYLAYVVRAFFENGGRRCWVVRVESDAANIATAEVKSATGIPLWQVQANSSGAWGNVVSLRLTETRRVSRRIIRATPDWADVDSVAGIVRAETVELIQDAGGTVQRELRVLSAVDGGLSRLIWNHPDPAVRFASDGPLTVIDPASPARIETVTYQLQVLQAGKLWRVYEDIALVPAHPRYGPNIVSGVAPLFAPDKSRAPAFAVPGHGTTADLIAFGKRTRTGAVPEPVRIAELRDEPAFMAAQLAAVDHDMFLNGGHDGLASLIADDFIGNEDVVSDSNESVLDNRKGIAALGEIDEISLAAIPDIHIQPRIVIYNPPPPCAPNPCLLPPPVLPAPQPKPVFEDGPPVFSASDIERVSAALVLHCERHRDRVALIDPPFATATDDRLGIAAIRDFRKLFDSTYAAIYFPWLHMPDPLPGSREPTLAVPPCGHVAGQIAAADLRVGVHKAPANTPLLLAERTTFAIGSAEHGLLNTDGINAIRAVPGRGLRVAGARLVSSNSDFRFLNVRRLLLMIERSLETSIQWAVFEGNDWLTRTKLALGIDSFLRELWSRGALMGASAEEAFFVRCDESNNPADARARGELLIQIGIAASVPFEFIVLRIGRTANGFELSEAAMVGG